MEYAPPEERDARMQDLVSLLLSVPKKNFDPFDIHRATYDSAGHSIGADIIIPRAKSSHSPRPVLVRIHGGFLVTGSSLFPAWFSKWILDFAEAQSAIIISPDYRLLPEAKGVDIIRDMEAFWKWFNSDGPSKHLAGIGRHDITLNKNKLLLLGESAGGYLAIQSVLSGFARPNAIVALYPMLDMKADHYTKEYYKPIVGVPNFLHKTIDDFLATLPARKAISQADPPARLDLALASVQTGRFLELLGDEPELFVLERIQAGNFVSKSDGRPIFPPFFILHGDEDSAVPAEGTRKFLQILDRVDPTARYRTAFRPGDHGFDSQATLEDEWLREGLDWVSSEWLADTSRM